MSNAKIDGRGQSTGSMGSRFKKGAPSPNAKGRPRGSLNRSKIISEVLALSVPANVDGKRKKIPVSKASLLKLVHLAVNGDRQAINDVLRLWKENDDEIRAEMEAQYVLTEADQAIIAEMHARMKACKEPQP